MVRALSGSPFVGAAVCKKKVRSDRPIRSARAFNSRLKRGMIFSLVDYRMSRPIGSVSHSVSMCSTAVSVMRVWGLVNRQKKTSGESCPFRGEQNRIPLQIESFQEALYRVGFVLQQIVE